MSDLTLTEQFGISLSRDIMQSSHYLLTSFIVIALSLMLLCAAAAVIVYRLRVKKPQFLFKRTTPLGFHRVMLAVMLLLAVINSIHLNSTVSIAIFAVSAVVLIAALFGMLRFSRFGLYAEICFIWLSLPIKELYSVLAVRKDFSELASFTVPGQAGVYAAAEYIVFRAIVLEIIAAVLTVLIIGYYSRRRYLFSDFARKNFNGLTECPSCGIPLVFEGDHCPSCGTDIRHLPRSVMAEEPIIIDRYCRECSKELRDGFCQSCASAGTTREYLGKKLGAALAEQGKAKLKGFIAMALALVIVIVPAIVADPLDYMVKGSSQANNSFVAKLKEVENDNSLADDPAWLSSFDAAADELYQIDSRAFSITPSKLDYNDLYAYIDYAEAAYGQMIIINKMTEAVHSKDIAALGKLGQSFDKTNDAMLSAITGSMSLLLSIKNDLVMSFENIIVDSLKYYLSFIEIGILRIVLLCAAVLSAAIAVVPVIKSRKKKSDELFESREYDKGKGDPDGLLRKQYKKERLLEAIVAAVTAAAIIGIAVIGGLTQPKTPQSLSQASTDLYVSQGAALEVWIADNKGSGAIADDQKERALNIIEAMRTDIAVINEKAREDEDTDAATALDITEDADELGRELDAFESALKNNTAYDAGHILDLINKGMQDIRKEEIEKALNSMLTLFDD